MTPRPIRTAAVAMAVAAAGAGCGQPAVAPEDLGRELPPATATEPDTVSTGQTAPVTTSPPTQPPASFSAPAVLFPDVLDATIEDDGDGSFTVAATISSPYDTADRYADAFRVTSASGVEFGVRELTHDHADEQPFTRSGSFMIPADVVSVIIQARDQISGWGGKTVTLKVPGR